MFIESLVTNICHC